MDKYNPVLNAEADARGVVRHQQTVLTAVDGKKKEATFKRIGGPEEGTEFTMPFAMLHVTPPMSAPDFLKAGPLVNENVRGGTVGGRGGGLWVGVGVVVDGLGFPI